MAVTRKVNQGSGSVAPKRRGRPPGSKNKAEGKIHLKDSEEPVNHVCKAVKISLTGSENKYYILCTVREALRDAGVYNTWKKFMHELYHADDLPFNVLVVVKNYIDVEVSSI